MSPGAALFAAGGAVRLALDADLDPQLPPPPGVPRSPVFEIRHRPSLEAREYCPRSSGTGCLKEEKCPRYFPS